MEIALGRGRRSPRPRGRRSLACDGVRSASTAVRAPLAAGGRVGESFKQLVQACCVLGWVLQLEIAVTTVDSRAMSCARASTTAWQGCDFEVKCSGAYSRITARVVLRKRKRRASEVRAPGMVVALRAVSCCGLLPLLCNTGVCAAGMWRQPVWCILARRCSSNYLLGVQQCTPRGCARSLTFEKLGAYVSAHVSVFFGHHH